MNPETYLDLFLTNKMDTENYIKLIQENPREMRKLEDYLKSKSYRNFCNGEESEKLTESKELGR